MDTKNESELPFGAITRCQSGYAPAAGAVKVTTKEPAGVGVAVTAAVGVRVGVLVGVILGVRVQIGTGVGVATTVAIRRAQAASTREVKGVLSVAGLVGSPVVYGSRASLAA